MREYARVRIESLSPNDNWLFGHMLIAFWHGFGIGNGLTIQKDDVEVVHYAKGPEGYRVKKEVMQAKLAEYLRWLERYQQTWGTDLFADCPQEDPYHPYHDSMELITRMIELLQV